MTPWRRRAMVLAQAATVTVRSESRGGWTPRGGCRGDEPDGPQAADRLSVAPRVAARRRARPGRERPCSSRAPSRRAGRIVGNDNDDDRLAYEPHYREITQPGQVQIYESIMLDAYGAVTTGHRVGAWRYAKDSRILPRGFDKRTASRDIAVVGDAASDPAFVGGSHRTRYNLDVTRAASGPFESWRSSGISRSAFAGRRISACDRPSRRIGSSRTSTRWPMCRPPCLRETA